jgi:CIC family chloride channel protein
MMASLRRAAAVVAVGVAAGLVTALVRAVLRGLGLVRADLEGGSRAGLAALHWPAAAWVVPLVALGLIGALLAARAARVAHEAGLGGVIDRINRATAGPPPGASGLVGLAATAALGLGVSGGPEGPLAMLLEEVVAWVRRVTRLDPEEELWLLDIGVGVALGLVFGAPLAAVVFPMELVLRRGFAGGTLLPALVAAGSGWAVMELLGDGTPLLGVGVSAQVPLGAYVAAVGLGVLAVGLGAGYRASVRLGQRLGAAGGLRGWLVAAAVLVVTSIAGFALPALLGTGASTLPTLAREGLQLSPWLLVALCVGRVVLTGASFAAGAPVGVLSPTLMLGLSAGLLVAQGMMLLGVQGIVGGPLVLGVTLMAVVFGAIGNMPLSMVLVGIEATGRLAIAGPLVVAMAIAWLLAQHWDVTLFETQVPGEVSWLSEATAPWPRARSTDRRAAARSAGSPTAIQPWPLPPPPWEGSRSRPRQDTGGARPGRTSS